MTNQEYDALFNRGAAAARVDDTFEISHEEVQLLYRLLSQEYDRLLGEHTATGIDNNNERRAVLRLRSRLPMEGL